MKNKIYIAIFLSSLTLCVGIWLFSWLHSAEYAAKTFVSIVNSDNYDELKNVVSEEELSAWESDNRKIHQIIQEIFSVEGKRAFIKNVRPEPSMPLDMQSKRVRYFTADVLNEDNALVKERDGKPVKVSIYCYNTRKGWKVVLTHFVFSPISSGRKSIQERRKEVALKYNNLMKVYDPRNNEWQNFYVK